MENNIRTYELNWLLQSFSPFMLFTLIFIHESLKSTPKDRLRNFSWQFYFFQKSAESFFQKSAERKSPREYFVLFGLVGDA